MLAPILDARVKSGADQGVLAHVGIEMAQQPGEAFSSANPFIQQAHHG
jgi:hypothetical protein